jgi:hypothetical protein
MRVCAQNHPLQEAFEQLLSAHGDFDAIINQEYDAFTGEDYEPHLAAYFDLLHRHSVQIKEKLIEAKTKVDQIQEVMR